MRRAKLWSQSRKKTSRGNWKLARPRSVATSAGRDGERAQKKTQRARRECGAVGDAEDAVARVPRSWRSPTPINRRTKVWPSWLRSEEFQRKATARRRATRSASGAAGEIVQADGLAQTRCRRNTATTAFFQSTPELKRRCLSSLPVEAHVPGFEFATCLRAASSRRSRRNADASR